MRAILLEKLLADFVDGIDIYLGCVRDLTAEEYKHFQGNMHRLPVEFASLRQRARECRQWDREHYDKNGFRENCIGIKDPLLQITPDGTCRVSQTGTPQMYKGVYLTTYSDFFLFWFVVFWYMLLFSSFKGDHS